MKKNIFVLFLGWRILLFLVAFLASFFISFLPTYPYWESLAKSNLPFWIWSWAGFDGVHYLTIAERGYFAQFTQAFFPLYPIVVRLFNYLVNNLVLSGIFLSNLFFLVDLYLFYKLVSLDFKKNLSWMIIFLLIFPTSFFFGSFYNESLFLGLVLGSFLAARHEKWWLVGILGCLASATRLVGVFLLPALFVEWLQQKNFQFSIFNFQSIFKSKIFNFKILWLSLIPIGLIFYMIYLQINFNDALYFLHAQPFFGASRTGGQIILLPQVIWRYLKIFVSVPINHYDFWVSLWEFGSFLLGLWLLFLAYRKKIRFSYQIFSWLTFLIPTLTGTFSSLPRYLLPIFPIFMILGDIKNTKLKAGLAVGSGILLILASALFTSGRWIA